jgi:prepilin-type N-terminal cleavage/methylation domain-containing protein
MRVVIRDRSHGFTLLELMIVVSIIGVLASVAIPSFLNYQLTAKRAEAYSNVNALAKAQKSYFAEFNEFVAVAPEPGASSMQLPNTAKRDVAPLTAAYDSVGWTPEGDVFFDYETMVGGQAGCNTCIGCFTSTAYGDLDGDMTMSEFVFFHPNPAGLSCANFVSGHQVPTDPVTNEDQWDTVVRHRSSDRW